MNISQNKSRIETCLEKLQKMFLIGISVDVKEPDYKQAPPPNSPIDIRFPQNPQNTPKIVIETDLWPCRDEKCNQLIDNHTDSEYYDEGKLWLEYTHLKLNSLDLVIDNISNIENDLN